MEPTPKINIGSKEYIAQNEGNPAFKIGQLKSQLHELEDKEAPEHEIQAVKDEIEKMAA